MRYGSMDDDGLISSMSILTPMLATVIPKRVRWTPRIIRTTIFISSSQIICRSRTLFCQFHLLYCSTACHISLFLVAWSCCRCLLHLIPLEGMAFHERFAALSRDGISIDTIIYTYCTLEKNNTDVFTEDKGSSSGWQPNSPGGTGPNSRARL